ncbi:MAG: ribosome maturation factor RimM [Azoarcus sp.]|jgi:16S rRNA processing protein RimM|nr:ribosome maturation factor RimM [Azoarcus sp.]
MIVLGRIVAPFGVKGWLNIQPFGDEPLRTMTHWWLCRESDAPAEQWRQYRLIDCREHGNGLVACLEGVVERTAAAELKGSFVAAPREMLSPLAADEFYWGDLVGLAVENEAGETLGVVDGLISTGAHDVLQLIDKGDGGRDEQRLIPFVAAYVIDVDLTVRKIRVAWQKDW